jgi:hypothetical protein
LGHQTAGWTSPQPSQQKAAPRRRRRRDRVTHRLVGGEVYSLKPPKRMIRNEVARTPGDLVAELDEI